MSRTPLLGDTRNVRRCRLALVDLAAAIVEQPHTVCRAGEAVTAMALEDGAAGPVAYLAIAREPAGIDAEAAADEPDGRGSRLVALDGRSGTLLAATAVRCRPASLVLAAAWDRPGSRLYSVEAPRALQPGSGAPDAWRLLALSPWTLDVERVTRRARSRCGRRSRPTAGRPTPSPVRPVSSRKRRSSASTWSPG